MGPKIEEFEADIPPRDQGCAKVALHQTADPFRTLDIDRLIEAEFLGQGGADFGIFADHHVDNIARQQLHDGEDKHRQHE